MKKSASVSLYVLSFTLGVCVMAPNFALAQEPGTLAEQRDENPRRRSHPRPSEPTPDQPAPYQPAPYQGSPNQSAPPQYSPPEPEMRRAPPVAQDAAPAPQMTRPEFTNRYGSTRNRGGEFGERRPAPTYTPPPAPPPAPTYTPTPAPVAPPQVELQRRGPPTGTDTGPNRYENRRENHRENPRDDNNRRPPTFTQNPGNHYDRNHYDRNHVDNNGNNRHRFEPRHVDRRSTQSNSRFNFGDTYSWQFQQNYGWSSNNAPQRYSQSQNYSQYNRPNFDFRTHSGHNFMGPHGSWRQWDNRWGDANSWARRWGFDDYDYNRGWRRGSVWYSHPSQWQDWGGWFSFFLSTNSAGGNGIWGYSYDNYSNDYYYGQNSGYDGYSKNNCIRLNAQDFIYGRRAIISFVACQTDWGTWQELPNTRRFEDWAY